MKKCKKCGSEKAVITDSMGNDICYFCREIINEVEEKNEGDYID